MKALFTLYTVLTVLQVFDVSFYGVFVKGHSGVLLSEEDFGDDVGTQTIKRTRTTTRTVKRGLNNQRDEDDDNGPLPTDVRGASKRLARTIQQEGIRRGVDLLNGGTGVVRMASDLGGMFSVTVARQAGNVRQVAREYFAAANGLGDSAGRGAVHAIRGVTEVGREVANSLTDVMDTTVDTSKRLTRLGGALVTTPLKIGGALADVGTSLVSVPKNVSRRVVRMMNDHVLARLGADQVPEPVQNDHGAGGAQPPARWRPWSTGNRG